MKLSILDGDALLHSGTYAKHSKDAQYNGFPTGGLFRLFREISFRKRTGDDVIICFDSKTDRREFMPTYKIKRKFSPSVHLQKHTVIPMLEKCGFNVLKIEGFESDDLVYNACKQNYDKYEKINIISVDYDLLYTLDIDGKVTFISSNGKCSDVSVANYDTVFNNASTPRKCFVPFNAFTAYKVFFEDVSDDIPAYKGKMDSKTLFTYMCHICKLLFKTDLPHQLTQKEVFLKILEHNIFKDEDLKEIEKRAHVFYPKPCSEDLTFVNRGVNNPALSEMYSLFGMKQCAKTDGITFRDLNVEELEFLKTKARELKDGAIHADLGIPIKPTSILQGGGVRSEYF